MRPVLVDSNVILDVVTSDSTWSPWSERTLSGLADRSLLVVNPIVYAEVAAGFETIEALDAAMAPSLFRREPLPWEAAFLASKCFVRYRRSGGTRTSTLPDFYIGAHAAVADFRLLTRDRGRYSTYFPTLDLISP